MAVAVPRRRKVKARPGRRLLRFDRAFESRWVAGADEAGRGSLAGPLVTAAVLLDHEHLRGHACAPLGLLDDSKRRTPEAREKLFDAVLACAERVAIIVIPAPTIDQRGLHKSNLAGLAQALDRLCCPRDAVLLTDGFRVPLAREHKAVVDGDAKSAAIAAASIVAKVTRDRLMHREHERYPLYGFDEHVGYITPRHKAAVRRHGPCPLHRRSFVSLAYTQLTLVPDELLDAGDAPG
jgi:ribonuclease HII